ncbi:EF-P lysine aminoacylase GenX [Aporhodopirellula aestuarii]|uniref:EF-P lysine aminoacylase GenX n=1 Tax=Aporhodopirellula aestuarii TaxID=2950107 RepID=A0ABT0TZQ6_9BACT|nr:amino acid--tRNA ligase-related protein [Aporhodopirellula aestuarii]MCM2370098.1 EF-P lysine aminoacylase GenX [Aporhodopirellula aestuarii]
MKNAVSFNAEKFLGGPPDGVVPVRGEGDFVDFIGQLAYRDRLLRLLRSYFQTFGFLEVQPPCLSRDCVIDAYLDPIGVPASELGLPEFGRNGDGAGSSAATQAGGSRSSDSPSRFYLQTSAESAMKRLLAQGAPSIFAISPVFRRGESGQRHNVEFTMLEWYEVGGDAESAIKLLGDLAGLVFGCDHFETVNYQDAFEGVLGVDPIESPISELSRLVSGIDAELALSIGEDRDALLDVLLSHYVEPTLGQSVPTVMDRYPVSQAALARPCEEDERFARRFELFYQGVELANGYDELQDWRELVRRYEINNEIRRQRGDVALPVETTLVSAMRRGLPRCSGVAVGVDRLLMLQTGARSIDEVIPLPITIA